MLPTCTPIITEKPKLKAICIKGGGVSCKPGMQLAQPIITKIDVPMHSAIQFLTRVDQFILGGSSFRTCRRKNH